MLERVLAVAAEAIGLRRVVQERRLRHRRVHREKFLGGGDVLAGVEVSDGLVVVLARDGPCRFGRRRALGARHGAERERQRHRSRDSFHGL